MNDLKPLRVPVPPMLVEALGYGGDARFCAFYWAEGCDELRFNDGLLEADGSWYAWRVYAEHSSVAPALEEFDFGSSDSPAAHWLLVDRQELAAYAGTAAEVARAVRGQHPPHTRGTPGLTDEQLRELVEAVSEKLTERIAEIAPVVDSETASRREHQLARELADWLEETDSGHSPWIS